MTHPGVCFAHLRLVPRDAQIYPFPISLIFQRILSGVPLVFPWGYCATSCTSCNSTILCYHSSNIKYWTWSKGVWAHVCTHTSSLVCESMDHQTLAYHLHTHQLWTGLYPLYHSQYHMPAKQKWPTSVTVSRAKFRLQSCPVQNHNLTIPWFPKQHIASRCLYLAHHVHRIALDF